MTKCFEVFVILGLLVFQVIPGLDPGIHKETGKELVVRWIAGSNPAMTKEKGRQKEKNFY